MAPLEPPSSVSADSAPSAPSPLEFPLICLTCGYDVRAIMGDICPECGQTLDRHTMLHSRLPWRRRGYRGLVHSYATTVWQVISNPSRIGAEVEFPIRFSDGRAFWKMTLLLVYAQILLTAALVLWRVLPAGELWKTLQDNPMGIDWAIACGVLGQFLAVTAVTGLPSYFCHPRRIPIAQQNRAITISYFAGGVLAALWIPLILAIVCLTTFHEKWILSIVLGNVVVWSTLALLIIWLNSTVRIILRATSVSGTIPALRIGLLLVFLWLAVTFLLAVLFPYLLYAMIMTLIHTPWW